MLLKICKCFPGVRSNRYRLRHKLVTTCVLSLILGLILQRLMIPGHGVWACQLAGRQAEEKKKEGRQDAEERLHLRRLALAL